MNEFKISVSRVTAAGEERVVASFDQSSNLGRSLARYGLACATLSDEADPRVLEDDLVTIDDAAADVTEILRAAVSAHTTRKDHGPTQDPLAELAADIPWADVRDALAFLSSVLTPTLTALRSRVGRFDDVVRSIDPTSTDTGWPLSPAEVAALDDEALFAHLTRLTVAVGATLGLSKAAGDRPLSRISLLGLLQALDDAAEAREAIYPHALCGVTFDRAYLESEADCLCGDEVAEWLEHEPDSTLVEIVQELWSEDVWESTAWLSALESAIQRVYERRVDERKG